MMDRSEVPSTLRGAPFATTHWSVVLQAGRSGEALEALCRQYWRPLYAFLRRERYDPHTAKDLTQGFFARLLARDDLAMVDRERGRFRTFLLVSLKHFLSNERDLALAKKRGGGIPHLSLQDPATAEGWTEEPADHLTADQAFDRRWALSLLETVLDRLETEFRAAGKRTIFDELKEVLTGERGEATYLELGRRLQMTETAVKVMVHRMRRRYRQLLLEEIARTVATPDQVEEELRHLIAALKT